MWIALCAVLMAAPACRQVTEAWAALEVRCLPWDAALRDFSGPPEFDRVIAEAAATYGVSVALIRAIIRTESEFDSKAVSPRGACGLMQLMPATARRFGVVDCFDARQNVLAGTSFLKALLTRYAGSVPLTVAAYNAGEGAVSRHRGVPPYRQTRAYVNRVESLLRSLEGRS